MPPARSPLHTPYVGPDRFPRRPSPLVRGAALAAAAALGVLIGLGLRGVGSNGWQTALSRLAVVALRLRGLPEFVTPDRDGGRTAIFGGLHVAVVAAAWGVVIGTVEDRIAHRTPRRAASVIGAVAAAGGLAIVDLLLPTPLRFAAGTLTSAEWVLAVVLVAAAAWAGARGARRAEPASRA